jgi:hypothetical protein
MDEKEDLFRAGESSLSLQTGITIEKAQRGGAEEDGGSRRKINFGFG